MKGLANSVLILRKKSIGSPRLKRGLRPELGHLRVALAVLPNVHCQLLFFPAGSRQAPPRPVKSVLNNSVDVLYGSHKAGFAFRPL